MKKINIILLMLSINFTSLYAQETDERRDRVHSVRQVVDSIGKLEEKDISIVDSFKHAGHVICTDFPTKAGIPIPGFSQAGLGQYLESIGLAKGWLSINIMDGAIGFLAIAEGHADLLKAISGNLPNQ